jgi:hypothetical protein
MNRLSIEGTEDSPTIILDAKANSFIFSGESRPENTAAFYAPVIRWLFEFEAYLLDRRENEQPIPAIRFIFRFEYFNSTSAKYIMDILKRLQSLHQLKYPLTIEWQYVAYDEDMLEAGQEWSKLIDAPFEFVAVEDDAPGGRD